MSPVPKSIKNLALGACRIGKPNLSVPQRCLLPCPFAAIRSGLMGLINSCWGVLLPTQAASAQWDFSIPLVLRLNFVLPPLPVSIGKPVCCNLLNNSHRVALTAAASFNGILAEAKIRLSKSGLLVKNCSINWLPLAWLHSWQANVKLLTRWISNCLSPMGNLNCCSYATCWFGNNSNACSFRTRVDFDSVRMGNRIFDCSILQHNRKRIAPKYCCFPFFEQFSCPCWVAGIKWFQALV